MARLFAVLTLICVGLFGVGAALADTKLRITLQLPITAPLGQNLVAFKEKVEAASAGSIEVEIYPGAQLFTDKEVPTAVATGQIEMGVSSLARFAGTIPAVDIFNVPFLFPTDGAVRAATSPGSAIRAPLDEAMAAKGARPLWWQPYGLTLIMLKEGVARRPVDLEGRKIRTFGKAHEAFINAMGGAATNISGSRQFLAYERGTVDGGMTGPLTIKDRKLYQVLESAALTNHAAIEFVVLINEQLWRDLGDTERAILTTAAREVEADLRDAFPKLASIALADATANGMTIYQPDEADLEAWHTATAPLEAVYLEAAGDLGEQLMKAAKGN
jgi:C4-dicarboxylate-binding protein DctP